MKPAAILKELTSFMRRKLKADAGARLCVGAITTKEDGSEPVAYALGANVERGDLATLADGLLRNISQSIMSGSHPECETCRDHLKRVEAARAALGLEETGRPS